MPKQQKKNLDVLQQSSLALGKVSDFQKPLPEDETKYGHFFCYFREAFPAVFEEFIADDVLLLDDDAKVNAYYRENKNIIYHKLEFYFQSAYAFLDYTSSKLLKEQSSPVKRKVNARFKAIFDEIFKSSLQIKDISMLYETARLGLPNFKKDKRSEVFKGDYQENSAEVAALFALIMQELYRLKDKMSETVGMLLRIANNSQHKNIFDLTPEELEDALVYSFTNGVNKEKLDKLKQTILAEHALLKEIFPYDETKEKYYFLKNSANPNSERIYLKSISVRLKSSESILRKLLYNLFDPKEKEKTNLQVKDYFGTKIIVDSKDRELLLDYLAQNHFLEHYKRKTKLIRISNSLKQKLKKIIPDETLILYQDPEQVKVVIPQTEKSEKEQEEIVLEELRTNILQNIMSVFESEKKVNLDSNDQYSATSFKYILPYGPTSGSRENPQGEYCGGELLVLDPEEEKIYEETHDEYRLKQILRLLEDFMHVKKPLLSQIIPVNKKNQKKRIHKQKS